MSMTPAQQARLDQMRAEIDDLIRLVAEHKGIGWEERAAHAKTIDNFEIYVESHTEAFGGEPS